MFVWFHNHQQVQHKQCGNASPSFAVFLYGEHGRNQIPATHINDSRHWRNRAAKMRALADWTNDVDAAAMMLRLADDYDLLADRADQRANGIKPQTAQQSSRPKRR